MKRIYVAHPYNGKEINKTRVEEFIRKMVKNNTDIMPVSPIHAMGYLYNDVGYEQGMQYCLELLKTCDELLLCEGWEESIGCKMEKAYAENHGIPINYVYTFNREEVGQ